MNASNGTAAEGRPDGRQAAAKATERNSVRVAVPVIGTVTLPPPEQLAFVGGIAVLTAVEVIEWPVAVALVAGHVLIARSHNKVVRDFGEALEEALSRASMCVASTTTTEPLAWQNSPGAGKYP